MGFVLGGVVLTLVSLAMLVPGLLKPRAVREVDMDQENLAISRERLQVLGEDEMDRDGTATELEAALLDDLGGPDYTLKSRPSPSPLTAVLLAVLIPLAAGGLYTWLGDMRWISPVTQSVAGLENDHSGEVDIPQLLQRLEQSLEENPENADGWAIAGRTYMALSDFAAAENAYARVQGLVGDDPDILTAWADASLMRNGGQFTPEIANRIERALALDPAQANALWIGAMGFRSTGDIETSEGYLARLRPLLAGNPEALAQLESMLAGSSALPKQAVDPGAVAAGIEVSLSVDSELLAGLDPATSVFLFARPLSGPPMPLAARKLTLADLPVNVTLDDDSGMIEGRTLSSVDRVQVTARVAKGGTPTAQPGDFTSDTVEAPTRGGGKLNLVIDRVVP